MNTKEAIDFIESKAIREYLRGMDYEPSALEAAYFFMNRVREKTFDEQKVFLLDLALSYPDIDKSNAKMSVPVLVYDYIEKTEEFINEFESGSFGDYYMYRIVKSGDRDNWINTAAEFLTVYSSFIKCREAVLKELEEDKEKYNTCESDTLVKIVKRHMDTDGFPKSAFYHYQGENQLDFGHVCDWKKEIHLLDIYYELKHASHPFKPGDIVSFTNQKDRPFVIINIPEKCSGFATGVFCEKDEFGESSIQVERFYIDKPFLIDIDYADDSNEIVQILEPASTYIIEQCSTEEGRAALEKMDKDKEKFISFFGRLERTIRNEGKRQ